MLQCRDIDALMMDWLYGELEPQNAQSFSTHVEDCSRCHTELAAYERTRELVGGIPTEEPPSAISAMLIREAASRSAPAKSAASSGGGAWAWLQRLLQPLQHPAMAAVATLVLVAGVAGTFYLKGKADVAEPDVSRPPAVAIDTSDEGERAPSADPALEEDGDEGLDRNKADDLTADTPETTATLAQQKEVDSRRADLLEAKRNEAARDLLQKSEEKKQRPTKVFKQNRERSKRRGKKAQTEFKQPVVAKPQPNAVSGTDPLQPFKPDKNDKAKGEMKPGEGGFEGDGTAEERPYRAYRDRPDGWVSQQQLRITEAYERKDCLTAAKIANDILDRSPELYTKITTKLEGVKRCKAYVAKEARKRQVARQKNTKSGGKAAGKAKRSAEPAPDADMESVK